MPSTGCNAMHNKPKIIMILAILLLSISAFAIAGPKIENFRLPALRISYYFPFVIIVIESDFK